MKPGAQSRSDLFVTLVWVSTAQILAHDHDARLVKIQSREEVLPHTGFVGDVHPGIVLRR
jgi:hypothetical protein